MNFWHLIRVTSERKWVVIGLVSLTLIVVAFAAPAPKVTYVATCQVSPTAQAMRGGASAATNSGPTGSSQVLEREVILSDLVLLAESGEVFQTASEFLALPEEEQRRTHPDLPAYKQIKRLLYSSLPPEPIDAAEWKDVLEVAPVISPTIGEKGTLSNVIGIRIKLPNADDAPFIANAVGVALADTYQRKSHEESRKYVEFLSSSMQEASKRLREIDAGIVSAKKLHSVVAIDPETQAAVTSVTVLESARDTAQAAVQESAAAVREIDRQLVGQPIVRTDPLPADLNPRVVKLKDELAQAEADLRMASTRYTPEHTAYKALATQIKILRDRIAQEGPTYQAPVMNDLHSALVKQRSDAAKQLAAATAKLAALNGQVRQAQNKLAAIPGAQRELAELTRLQQTAADDYTTYAQKLALSKTSDRESKETGSVIVFDPARSAIGPVVDGPRKPAQLAYGFVLSLVLGLAFCVWLDSIDKRIRNQRDAEDLLGLPAMGLIPALAGVPGGLPGLTNAYPLSAAAESYRLLRTQLLFAHRDNPFRTLMIASSKPGQGATTTVCNLAIALAQIGKRVVLVDADMRRPSLHAIFGVSNETGLSTILQRDGDALDGIKQTEIRNLTIVPAGPPPLNPSELLASEHVWEVVKQLQDQYDIVLFDTPSVAVFSDGQVLASWLDAVLFVVSASQVPAGTEKQALEMLSKTRANVIGTVVNRLDFDSVESCRFHSRYYASRLGETALPEPRRQDERDDAVDGGTVTE